MLFTQTVVMETLRDKKPYLCLQTEYGFLLWNAVPCLTVCFGICRTILVYPQHIFQFPSSYGNVKPMKNIKEKYKIVYVI
jgi:hypothetical protein